MRKFVLTSERFTGNVLYGFSEAGILVYYENTTKLNNDQILWFINNLPTSIETIQHLAKAARCQIEEIPEDLSFEAFWEKYGKKINKKRCEPLWKKMNDAQRLTCLRSIEPYKGFLLRTGYRSQLDPENYLKNGSYETNWNREK